VLGFLLLTALSRAQAFRHELREGAHPENRWARDRAALVRELHAAGGRHLIFVRYGPNHNVHTEWVANGADLAGTAVLWARDLGSERNAALLRLDPYRRAWLLTFDRDEEPYRLSPLPTP
jgi:hypothetical protein